jgi:hypothetical protein
VALLLGWVLLIGEEYEQGRVIVAIFVSIAFLALHFAVKPFARFAATIETTPKSFQPLL